MSEVDVFGHRQWSGEEEWRKKFPYQVLKAEEEEYEEWVKGFREMFAVSPQMAMVPFKIWRLWNDVLKHIFD